MAEVNRRDRGLQPQRTALAWSRTGLAIFVNALIILRAGMQSDQILISALGIALLVASALAVVTGTWRIRYLAAHGAPVSPPWILIASTTGVAWLACLGGVASIILTLP